MDTTLTKLINNKSALLLDDAIPLRKKSTLEIYKMLEFMLKNMINTTIMVSCQFSHFDKNMQNYFDYIFVGKEYFKSNIEKMFTDFGNKHFFSCDDFKSGVSNLKAYNFLLLGKDQMNSDDGVVKEIQFNDCIVVPNDLIWIFNPIGSTNVVVVNNIIKKLEGAIDEMFVVRADTTGVKNILEDVLKEINCKKKKLLIIEYKFVDVCNNYNSLMREIVINGRHYNISVVIVEKSVIKIAPEMRVNVDRWIIGGYDDKSSLQRLYDYILGMFPVFSDVKMVMGLVNENKLLTVNERVRNGSFHEKVHIINIDPMIKAEKYPFEAISDMKIVPVDKIDIHEQLKLINENIAKILDLFHETARAKE
ncbi:MAG: putative VV A32-like packaging ATPase [Hyperionvirus sp.]|uniref:Putative VV A32-like packaging ATPase n=1 Tax=Hyperionvirus sp. TaxID=2487770 RepID=A0A3G5ABF0_9VIRU|nr:MAG: putative VV A32-like packaging ATPase [Hyperionvirus sp.]